MAGETYDKEQVRERITLAELYEKEIGPLRRAGTNKVGLCPFHEERTGSFNVFAGDAEGKCFGCDWSGDIFDFWEALRGVEFREALAQLAGLTGVSPRVSGVDFSQRRKEFEASRRKRIEKAQEWKKWPMPEFEAPTPGELEMLAASRGLQVGGLERAVADGRLFMTDWPQFYRRSDWATLTDPQADYYCEAARSWVVTDRERWVAQYRRLDGEPYRPIKDGHESKRKSWSTKNVSWPVGAAELNESGKVLLIEGGADMLAGYHFMWGLGIDDISICCIFGATNPIAEQARDYFKGKRVKIVKDADPPRLNQRTGVAKSAGAEAAARWQMQLNEAGAAVAVYDLEGLETAVGKPVKDLNDLALASRETITSDEVWGALFFDWDF